MTDQFDTPEKRSAWLKSFPKGSQPEPIVKDCRENEDENFVPFEDNVQYQVTEDLFIHVTGGTMVFHDGDGTVAFIISESDFSNFVWELSKDRIDQAIRRHREGRDGK